MGRGWGRWVGERQLALIVANAFRFWWVPFPGKKGGLWLCGWGEDLEGGGLFSQPVHLRPEASADCLRICKRQRHKETPQRIDNRTRRLGCATVVASWTCSCHLKIRNNHTSRFTFPPLRRVPADRRRKNLDGSFS